MKLPAGKYYIGDPCYVLTDHNGFSWDHVLTSTDFFGMSTEARGGVFEYKGTKMFASSTAWGDGCYKDNYGRSYGVDAGLLSAIPLSCLTNFDERLGHVVEFDSSFPCYPVDEDGDIVIGHVIIETNPTDDGWG